MATVLLKDVKKVYSGNVTSVHDFNLEIADKEFVVFVGPSGCGKSTTLRMIAGLEDITEGELYIDGVLCNDLQPKDRNISMVFQNYALYPHLTVYENLAFPLRLMKHPKLSNEEIYKRVTNAAEILGITQFLARKPKALSGGQRQRVAIGRAIVRDCKVLLMDEPLSNLDAKLRNQMRAEIILLRKKINTTFIYVTHDQTEAMTLGDRIVIMKDGFIMQVGTPAQVFDSPDNLFVASFIGSPSMNFIHGKYKAGKVTLGDGSVVEVTKEMMKLHDDFYKSQLEGGDPNDQAEQFLRDTHGVDLEKFQKIAGGEEHEVVLGIRPEHITLVKEGTKGAIPLTIEVNEMMGSEYHIHANMDDGSKVIVRIPTISLEEKEREEMVPDHKIYALFGSKALHLFDPDTEISLLRKKEAKHEEKKAEVKEEAAK
ncbi:MAG: ATP-binding cassette domain-containing protein [Bacilli bacterium]|nr:ATP-binding cassette domain-containing protein [Bacilli bacterium]